MHRRVKDLPDGVRVLDTSNSETLLQAGGVSLATLEEWKSRSVAERNNASDDIDAFAIRIAKCFLEGSMEFWDADAVLNYVMVDLSWEAPLLFWEIFIAFEDFETTDNPENDGRSRIEKLIRKHTS